MFRESAYNNETIVLEALTDDAWGEWCDFYGSNGEVVVTYKTLRRHLENRFKLQSRGTDADKIQVDARTTGVYLTDTHYNNPDKVDESYLIIADDLSVDEETFKHYLNRIEEQYNRTFQLASESMANPPY